MVFMVSNADYTFDELSLDDLVDLLVKKTTEYLGLVKQKDVDDDKLKDLKSELNNLHSVIAYRRTL